jgi:chromatin modification-related protein VID21
MLTNLQQAQMQRNGQMPNQQAHPNGNAPNRPGPNMPHPQGSQAQPGGPQQINHQGLPNGQHPAAAAQGGNHLNSSQNGMRGGIPQAQMQPNTRPTLNGQAHGAPDGMQQRVLEAQRANQTKMNGQQYQMAPPNRASPGGVHVPNGVGNQSAMNGMQNVRTPGAQAQNYQSTPNGNAASPHMPPPPTPTGQSQQPSQLSSGHVPNIASITHQLQAQYPQASAEKIQEMATERLRHIHLQGQHQQSHQQARQSALSAAAGTHATNVVPNGSPAYHQNQTAFQQNNANGQHAGFNASGGNPAGNASNSSAQQYAAGMRQRVLAQQSQMQHQNQNPSVLNNGSPRVAQASPAPGMAVPSPNMAAHPAQNIPVNATNRTPAPPMRRMGSGQGVASSGTPQTGSQLQQTPSAMQRQSPVVQQASPRPVSAGVARQ